MAQQRRFLISPNRIILRIFAPARWICAPCHNLQAVSPTENIVTMYETIHEHGRL